MNLRDRLFTLLPAGLAALSLAFAPVPASAGGTKTFEVTDYDDLDKGETEGAAIEASGRVTVGFSPVRAELPGRTAFVCLPVAGAALVGTADAATIQRVEAGPRKKKTGKGKDAKTTTSLSVTQLAKLDGVVVSAMVELPGGDILAATLPGGTIHRVDRKGKVTPFAKLAVEQIWGLLVHKGKLWVATGPKGELWTLSLAGKDAKVVLDVEEKDLLSLLAVGDQVIVGTSPAAKLYQVGKDLEGVLLHDFTGDEVRALALTKQGLVAAVNEFSDRKLTSLEALTKTLDRTSLVGQPPAGSLEGGDKAPSADARLYHVDLGPKRDLARASEAAWETWLDKKKQYFTAVLAQGDAGTVLVSSSDSGKIHRVRGPRDVATIADLEERQATALCRLPKAGGGAAPVFATTAHGAAVYQLLAAPATKARWRSDVLDADQPASYGAVRLRGRGALELRARTGPTEEPDKRWSEWKKIPLSRESGALRGSLAAVAHRRYVQLEVSLPTADSELRAIELFYAPENLPPLLTSVEIDRPGFDDDDDDEPDANATIKWKADARDDDKLVYDVRVRPEGSGSGDWIVLTPPGELTTKAELKWDLTSVPDGVYEVEVTASDEPSNGSARALEDKLESAPFVVDRQRPSLTGLVVDGKRVRGTASDSGGFVHDVSYALDGGPFRAASPKDGLYDGATEDFEGELPADLGKGNHRVTVRVRDAFGNIASSAVTFKK